MHWLVLLLGDEVVDAEVLGVRSRPHEPRPSLHARQAGVDRRRRTTTSTPCAARRCWSIRTSAARASSRRSKAAARNAGGSARIDGGILEEVNCLVEWPSAVACSFEREFLAVPQEALIATMETNQKFFPVLDADGRLTEHFIGIANIESQGSGARSARATSA